MEIHRPKPWHGWREFAKEIGTIVIGVLIALAAEQAVEALHRRHEIREASTALETELAWNLMAFEVQTDEVPCSTHRLDELRRWADLSASGARPVLSRPIGAPPAFGFRTSIWRAVAPVVAQMPLEQRLTYAEIYDDLDNAQKLRDADRAAWRDMGQFREAGVSNDDRRGRLAGDIGAAQAAETSIRVDDSAFKAPFARLGIKAAPRPDSPLLREAQRAFCAPLLTR